MIKLIFIAILVIGVVGCWQAHDHYRGNHIPDEFFDLPPVIHTYYTTWDMLASKTNAPTIDTLSLYLFPEPTKASFLSDVALFHFELSGRSRIAFWLYSIRDSAWTKPIIDTIDGGSYFVRDGGLKDGDYAFKAEIGDSIQMRQFHRGTIEVRSGK
jgi:hypothetical protein